ncbi:MAG: O-antigen polymerase [Actinomycetia bacterium]|nr:O-antigen polymerase [Actinomycetes bacterium]
MSTTVSTPPAPAPSPVEPAPEYARPGRLTRPWVLLGLCAALILTMAFVYPAGAAVLGIMLVGGVILSRSHHDVVTLFEFFLLLAFLIPSPLVFTSLGGAATPALLLGIAALFLWINGRITGSSGLATGFQPMRWAVGIWGWTILASCAAAFARPLPKIESQAPYRGTATMLGCVGITLLATDGIRSRDRLEKLLQWTVWSSCFVAVVGLIQFTTGYDLASKIHVPGLGSLIATGFIQQRAGFNRVAGTAGHPIEFAVVMCAVLPLALHYAFFPTTKRKWVPWIPVGLILAAIPTSLSRTSVIGLAIVALFLVPTWHWRRQLGAILGVGALVGLMQIVYPGILSAMVGLFTQANSDVSITTRKSDYSNGFDLIRKSPFYGRGFKTFIPDVNFFIDNQYLMSAIETGIIGALALIALFVIGVSLARGARHRSHDFRTQELGQAIAASLATIMVCFATFDALSFPMITGLTFLLLGVAGALWRMVREEESPAANRAPARSSLHPNGSASKAVPSDA